MDPLLLERLPLDALPLEILSCIALQLTDSVDVASLRLTCKKLRDACMYTVHKAQWPRGHTELSLPWRPKTLQLTKYIPLPLSIFNVSSVSCTLRTFQTVPLNVFSNIKSLTIDYSYGTIDLQPLSNLRSLTVYGGMYIFAPRNLTSLSIRNGIVTNLAECINLHTLELSRSDFDSDFELPRTLHHLQTLRLSDMTITNPSRLEHVNHLYLQMCRLPPPAVLRCETLYATMTGWTSYPELPNVRVLTMHERFYPLVRAQDINQCVSVNVLTQDDIEASLLPLNFQALTCLNLKLNIDRFSVFLFPPMPLLESLSLSDGRIILPPMLERLTNLTLRSIYSNINVTGYPRLREARLTQCKKDIIISNLPNLVVLTVHSTQLLLSNTPHLHTLAFRNIGKEATSFYIPSLPFLKVFYVNNVSVVGLSHLASVSHIEFNNCKFENPSELNLLQHATKITMSSCSNIIHPSICVNACELDFSSSNVQSIFALPLVRKLTLNACPLTVFEVGYSLHTLNLDFTNIRDLEVLRDHRNLTHLSICDTSVTDLTPLATISTLRTVLASSCDRITDANALLHVNTVDLSDCELLLFANELHGCETLDLRGCKRVPWDVLQFLATRVSFFDYDQEHLDMNGHENDGDQH